MNNLKLLRKEKNISQAELARYVGVVKSAMCQYESGARQIPDEIKFKLADYFNVSVDYLLGRTENKEKALGINQGQEELKNIPVALYEGVQGLSPEGMQDVIKYIEFVKAKEKGGK